MQIRGRFTVTAEPGLTTEGKLAYPLWLHAKVVDGVVTSLEIIEVDGIHFTGSNGRIMDYVLK